MTSHRPLLLVLLAPVLLAASWAAAPGEAPTAPKPAYRDPVHDGAADPVLVRSREDGLWRMFHTIRRANVPDLPGVAWVHGTPIGIAVSRDGGNHWTHEGLATIDAGVDTPTPTYWAPEIIDDGRTYHMFLTVVPGVFEDWRHPRHIVHLTSQDLRNWGKPRRLKLVSDKVIDACVARMPDGKWRLWYNNEVDRKAIYWAESDDLLNWSDKGKAVGDQAGEGPKVFRWKGLWWMITDVWRGLALYRSEDATHWVREPGTLLGEPGTGQDDEVMGGHADVVVHEDRAFVYYFTHPGRRGPDAKKDGPEQRRSSIQVAELEWVQGEVRCDRNRPVQVNLGGTP